MLYSRLNLFRSISAQLVTLNHLHISETNGTSTTTTGSTSKTSAVRSTTNGNGAEPASKNPTHFYEMLLGLCERLFENEIEQHAFEDQMRVVFGLKVILFE